MVAERNVNPGQDDLLDPKYVLKRFKRGGKKYVMKNLKPDIYFGGSQNSRTDSRPYHT
jgi:hypothetical protein